MRGPLRKGAHRLDFLWRGTIMPTPSEKGSRALLPGALLFAAAIGGFVLGGFCSYISFHFSNETPLSTEAETPLQSGKPDKVVARGRIEPKYGILSVGVPTPDRLRELRVKEGHTVKRGDLLAVLDSEAMRSLEQKLAIAQLHQARERLAAIKKNGEAQIRVAQERLKQIAELEPFERQMLRRRIELLKKQEKDAQKNAERYIAAGDTIAKQDIEKQDLALQQIQAELEDAQVQLEKFRKSTVLNRSMAQAQLEAAQAELEQGQSAISLKALDTQIQQAEERLKETKILAPSDGKILRLFVHEGELVGTRPILEMANVDQMIALTEVYESDIERVKLGQSATVASEIGHLFQGENVLHGEVIEIASIIGKAKVVPLDPLTAADKRVVEVKVALKPGREQAKRLADLIGHQVLVEIDAKPGPAKGPR